MYLFIQSYIGQVVSLVQLHKGILTIQHIFFIQQYKLMPKNIADRLSLTLMTQFFRREGDSVIIESV